MKEIRLEYKRETGNYPENTYDEELSCESTFEYFTSEYVDWLEDKIEFLKVQLEQALQPKVIIGEPLRCCPSSRHAFESPDED